MDMTRILEAAQDQSSVRRVFGEPFEKDGTTIIPAARIMGGGGAGLGLEEGQQGEGGGLGLVARPVGVYVLRNGEVTWQPAVDVNRVVTALATVLVVATLARAVVRRRAAGG